MTFPFEAVHDQLARAIIAKGIPKNAMMPPGLLIVSVDGSQIVDVTPMPAETFLESLATKQLLNRFLNITVPRLPANTCLALISEAYHRTVEKTGDITNSKDLKAEHNIPDSLEDDPLAIEVVSIQLFRPESMRVGALPIRPDRTLEYRPLDEPHEVASGRFVPESTKPPKAAKKAELVDIQKQACTDCKAKVPSPEQLVALHPGLFVQVGVPIGGRNELFWVKITLLDGPKLVGTIHNDLFYSHRHGWEFGDTVVLERRHIRKIQKTLTTH